MEINVTPIMRHWNIRGIMTVRSFRTPWSSTQIQNVNPSSPNKEREILEVTKKQGFVKVTNTLRR